jgi:ubiquinone/menaquinone biosynthesis C-methylase UbiE
MDSKTEDKLREASREANREVHSKMASTYADREPHFRPENQRKVLDRLAYVTRGIERGSALDLGCGSGFLTEKLSSMFESVDGIDVTPEMTQHIDLSLGNISVHHGPAEVLPFADDSFCFVGSYSFLHHVYEPAEVVAEAFRVLRPGGVFYADLEPNSAFWNAASVLRDKSVVVSELLEREVSSVIDVSGSVEEEYGIPADVFNTAELVKSERGGFSVTQLEKMLREVGFVDVSVRPDWFLAQGRMIHNTSPETAALMEDHLRELMPITEPLFKYLWMTARKP